MKKSEIAPALNALKEIKVHKIEDKDLRNVVIDDHFTLLDAGKKTDAAVEDKKKVFLEAYKDEEQSVQDLQTKINEAASREEQIDLAKQLREGHKDYLDAVKVFNDEANKLYNEDVPGLKKIDREKMMEELKKQEIKLAWVEALYPLFVLEEEKPTNKK